MLESSYGTPKHANAKSCEIQVTQNMKNYELDRYSTGYLLKGGSF